MVRGILYRQADVAQWPQGETVPDFSEAEQGWMDGLLEDMGFCDAYREMDSEAGNFSWWPNSQCRQDNIGMRFDYQIITRACVLEYSMEGFIKARYSHPMHRLLLIMIGSSDSNIVNNI